MKNLKFAVFVEEFVKNLFGANDRIRLANLQGGVITNTSLTRAQAIKHLQSQENVPNVYFAPCVHNGAATYEAKDFLRTSSICLDIDYGTVGHKKPSFFKTFDEAFTYVRTLPIQPQTVWHTGHGVQLLYKLNKPVDLTNPVERAVYNEVVAALAKMAQADGTPGPEHLFRVPMTLNQKPNAPVVRGDVLWSNRFPPYSLIDLASTCEHYGTPGVAQQTPVPQQLGVTPYKKLPEEIRDEIELPGHSDRSGVMFDIIVHLMRRGYSDATIQAAIQKGPDFVKKYKTRLNVEVARVLAKVRNDTNYVYRAGHVPLMENTAASDVDDAPLLPSTVDGMLNLYHQMTGVNTMSTIKTTAQFLEHVFTTQPSGVMETPCGCGKSTWALCHIAANATPTNRYFYVVETIDALYRAADLIERLNPRVQVGRYHGFNGDQCFKLCGVKHTWPQCVPKDKGSACHHCAASKDCAFFNRDTEMGKDVVVLAHEGFIRLLETVPASTFNDITVIVDEDLGSFLYEEFAASELELAGWFARAFAGVTLDLSDFFPYSSVALQSTSTTTVLPSPTFASMHYVYRPMAASPRIVKDLRAIGHYLIKSMSVKQLLPAERKGHTDLDVHKGKEVLIRLRSFFNGIAVSGGAYAYREVQKGNEIILGVKKGRLDLRPVLGRGRLWVLSASARISNKRYPDGMQVYRCPQLTANSGMVQLHVIRGNPMQTKVNAYANATMEIVKRSKADPAFTRVLLTSSKDWPGLQAFQTQLRNELPKKTKIMHLARGRLKGTNEAGECTAAILSTCSFFTTIDDCALSAAILLRRTLPTSAVFNKNGAPAMPGGAFSLQAMQEYYARGALDEIYQAIYRTAVRNGRRVHAIVVLPDEEWLSALWRTVMPGLKIQGAYSFKAGKLQKDRSMDCFVTVMHIPAGATLTKIALAQLAGYVGKKPWQDNQPHLESVLAPFFKELKSGKMVRL